MTQQLAIDETDRLISSDKVDGTAVYNRTGERLGTIKNFMVDKHTGKADYAVLQFGGLFGLGSDHYPIPWQMLDYDVDQGGYVVNIDKSQLEGAPRYGADAPVYDRSYGESVYGHYGLAYPYV